jgi:hypothetical protein
LTLWGLAAAARGAPRDTAIAASKQLSDGATEILSDVLSGIGLLLNVPERCAGSAGWYSVVACHLLRGGRENCYTTPGKLLQRLRLPSLIAPDRNYTKSIVARIPDKHDRMAEAH